MTTERDIQNQIEYAHEEGLKEGAEQAGSLIAAKLKAQGVPIKVISEATGLTEQQIQNL